MTLKEARIRLLGESLFKRGLQATGYHSNIVHEYAMVDGYLAGEAS
ncbi:MAG: hypothetical protein ABWW69_05615 [Pyrodictiaceae archaeon]